MKKFITFILTVVFSLIPATVYAGDFDAIEIEQVNANLPEVTAYLYLVDGDGENIGDFVPDKNEVTAILGDSSVDIVSFENAENVETTYYYLLDVSTSVSKSVFGEVKKVINEHIERKTAYEKIVVITFGKEITVVLDGNENTEEAKEKIEKIKPNETATRLFDGLDKMLTLSANDTDGSERKIAVLVSDGADLYNGGATKDEVLERIVNENIALYSMALPNANKNGIDAMESFSQKSGGELMSLKSGKVGEGFEKLYSRINGCLVLKMKTENNIIKSASQTFVVKVPYDKTVLEATCSVKTTKWIEDMVAPKITECISPSWTKLEIKFSENVAGAEDPSNFVIYSIEEGKEIEIISASYSGNNFTATIILGTDIYNGDYLLNVRNISDVSMESNGVANPEKEFSVSEEGRDRPLTFGEKLAKYWYIVAIIIIILVSAAAAIIIFIKKTSEKKAEKAVSEKQQEEELLRKAAADAVEKGLRDSVKNQEMGHIRIGSGEIKSKKITLVINNGGIQKSIDVLISGKYTIGRSKKCNLSFDDKSMSREHCALDYINGVLVAEDLGSTNGTIINGICIKGIYCLNDGDVIDFGRTRITIRF